MGCKTGLPQSMGERCAVVHKRLAAGNNCQPARMGGSGLHQFGYGMAGVATGIPRLFYIAPDAADVATAQANEIGSLALVEAFTLKGIELLHDRQRGFFIFHFVVRRL